MQHRKPDASQYSSSFGVEQHVDDDTTADNVASSAAGLTTVTRFASLNS